MTVPLSEVFLQLGAALGVGLLVGLQRERSGSAIAGVRTFALLAMLGAVTAILAERFGAWTIAAGMVGVAALAVVGNMVRAPADESPGVTTEAAMLLIFAVGAMTVTGPMAAAVAVGAAAAVLLHIKPHLRGLIGRLSESDVKAIMQFAAIALIILPIVPDRPFGPFGVLNAHNIWLMVVLVVGISLLGYVAYRLVGERSGTALAGALGGLISSTATTASFARRSRGSPGAAGAAALAIILASTVVYGRVLVEVYAVAPRHFVVIAGPVGAMLAVSLVLAGVAWLRARDGQGVPPDQQNPAQLKGALLFAGLYAVVTVVVAAANHFFGHSGTYVVAAISGLTDMDAITLSTGRMASAGTLAPGQAATAIVIASMANLAFKTGMAAVIGGGALLRRLGWMMGTAFLSGASVIALWTSRMPVAGG